MKQMPINISKQIFGLFMDQFLRNVSIIMIYLTWKTVSSSLIFIRANTEKAESKSKQVHIKQISKDVEWPSVCFNEHMHASRITSSN